MGDLPLSIAACLTAHSLNIGYRPIAKKGVPALERSRLSHVYQNYFRPETLSAANVPLVDAQATLRLAQAWGGGLVAAVDGMRFVVPRSRRVRPPEPQVLRLQERHDLAKRDKRSGHGSRSQDRLRHDS